jgi:hypothetical protein
MIQSSYLPWRGYFDLIDDVDLFVFYDDVQYVHRTWRNRNVIKTFEGPLILSVPVIHRVNTLIQDARIDHSSRWAEKHIRSISHAYVKAPYFRSYGDELFGIITARMETISQLNIAVCRWAMRRLGIETEIRMSTDFNVSGDKFSRPLEILKRIGASGYLSGPTAREYTDIEDYRNAGVRLEFKSYNYPEYPQLFGPFVPNLSIIDLLFNCGEGSRDFLKSMSPNELVI